MKRRTPVLAAALCAAALTCEEIESHTAHPVLVQSPTLAFAPVRIIFQPVHTPHSEAAIGQFRETSVMASTATASALPMGTYSLDALRTMLSDWERE